MTPSWPGVAVFVAVLAFVAAALVGAAAQTAPPGRTRRDAVVAAAAVAAWMGVTGAIVASGVLEGQGLPVPRPMPYVLGQVVTVVAIAASPLGARLARLPLAALLGFQAFRLPLEGVLHRWYAEGAIPVQMTWSGENLDVLTGILGVVVAAVGAWRPLPRAAAWAANLVGFALLLNVMRIALRSVPGPQFAYAGPPLVLPFSLPYGWIVPMCVMTALLGHLVTFRALARW